mmetsp:Transcript_12219/g.32801  ORF Transcript_12219/g.32801 Transcript_12219/m.32801 type:complete len:104 (-) Transcript_12219:129-440(-)
MPARAGLPEFCVGGRPREGHDCRAAGGAKLGDVGRVGATPASAGLPEFCVGAHSVWVTFVGLQVMAHAVLEDLWCPVQMPARRGPRLRQPSIDTQALARSSAT